MISCSSEFVSKLRAHISYITRFLNEYKWIQDAYVSDFFFCGHWERLPQTWQCSLSQVSAQELSWLVDKSQDRVNHVLPLSLLSFRACTQTFSADRYPSSDIESQWKELIKNKLHISCREGSSITDVNCQSLSASPVSHDKKLDNSNVVPVIEDGVLHYFYRKHVKPKKQHEIVNLAKVIQLLSDQIGCSHVVDVGGGLGHLSRLISFGYGLQVTSVEASDGHAPKANKYDREVDREIKKKKNQTSSKLYSTPTNLPHHVTSMICPNMTTGDFLAIIQAQDITDTVTDASDAERKAYNTKQIDKTMKCHCNKNCNSQHFARIKHGLKDGSGSQIASKVAKLDDVSIGKRDETEKIERNCDNLPATGIENNESPAMETSIPSENVGIQSKTIEVEGSYCVYKSECDIKVATDMLKTDMDIDEYKIKTNEILTQTCNCDNTCNLDINDTHKDTKTKDDIETEDIDNVENQKHIFSSNTITDEGFILTGLHACGDLTPTFLRFFVNCSAAKGLASVGCCYMKLTHSHSVYTETGIDSCIGYPMSEYVRSLPDHELSYNSRELACHFADTYSKRLKDNAPHLKIHSYRAALEWIANQLCPNFKRSAVQIPAKKTNKMDFESYVRQGLVKFGISLDLLTQDLLDTALKMTERWKDVVAFYTLRLSLAPVIETLVLLDRMMFLHEHGLSSILLPIFDPNISPRNFVLIAWK